MERLFTVARVPTGMKAGVCKDLPLSFNSPRRAIPSSPVSLEKTENVSPLILESFTPSVVL